MSLWLSIVTRATGLPDKRYLNDPVIFRYYQQKIHKAPFALVGWTLCFLTAIGVSLGLELSNMMLLLVLLVLFLLMVLLQSRYQFMHPERSISARFYQEVLDDASVSDIQKEQFKYLFVSKVDALTIGDLYRLYDFNRGGR
ncbi:hypothetical protein DL738_11580 [Escherichia coli]|uniref:Membrane protein n=1 Tax=Salmonella enterica I TaxID=59201 RepID=A0A379Y1S0_SALET|nr:hypothetical protein [Salmonella enterica]EGE2353487.1 hypothetical protein [Escherichia coli]SUI39636.1 membrane protein [Salmonella enterica subsp. enterica]EFR0233292.1 hypothetical protein [Salmonella enterica]EGH2839156.1 hypothetical protein [Salmonella enterica]